MIKYILFDFDGTLVDSREVFITAFNHIADKYHFKRIEQGNFDHLWNLSMIERLRFLRVPLYKVPFLTKEFLSLYSSNLGSVSLIAGMKPVLRKIANRGVPIGLFHLIQ